MEEKIMYNVLKAIELDASNEYHAAPDHDYLSALRDIGLINLEWDNTLTDFGRKMLKMLENNRIDEKN